MKKSLLVFFVSIPFLAMSQNTWLIKSNFPGVPRMAAVAFSIGGKGYLGTGANFGNNYYNDFWEYDPISDSWTQKATLPTLGRFRAIGFANMTKGYVGTGAESFSSFNDFWEYDPVTNVWSAKADMGISARCEASGFIIGDKIYAGTGYITGISKDFWEYDIFTDTWSQKADFGGLPKVFAVGFSIGSKGYLGTGNDSNVGWGTKDFWEYDPSSNIWTQKNDFPGTARSEAFGFAIGNYGYIGTGTMYWGNGALNDLWKYDPVSDSWFQMANFPGGIREHASCFVINCKAYISTGFVNDNNNTLTNDLWEYTPDHTCSVSAAFSSDNQLCPGACIDFTNLSVNSTSYSWSFPGGSPSTSNDIDPANICYNTPGNYDVTLIASNLNVTDTLILLNYITVFPQPPPQGIVQTGDTLIANQGATSYQWYFNGSIIPGATDYFYVAQMSGDYNVVATDVNGCEVEAVINNVLAAVTPLSFGEGSVVRFYPNPVDKELIIKNEELIIETAITISIYNLHGALAFQLSSQMPPKSETSIDVSALMKGMYWLEITAGEKTYHEKFLKK